MELEIGHAMRCFRRALQMGSIRECTGVVHDTSSLELVYNARTLPGHCCWNNLARVILLTPQFMPRVQLYGCLDCSRTHLCRGRATADDSAQRDETSDLCPLRATDESSYLCAFSARAVTDATPYATYASYNDWLDKQDLSYDDDEGGEPRHESMTHDSGGGGEEESSDDMVLRLHRMKADTQRYVERSQFSEDMHGRTVAQNAKTAAAHLTRGIRQARQVERHLDDARKFTHDNRAAYRAMEGDVWLDDDAVEGEEEAEHYHRAPRASRMLMVDRALEPDANRGTYAVTRSRPALRDYDYWSRYHFVGDRSLKRLFGDDLGEARRTFTLRRAAPAGSQPAAVRFRRIHVRANGPPSLLGWLNAVQRMNRAGRLALGPDMAERIPPVPLRWMSRVDELLAQLWSAEPEGARRGVVDFLARWVRLGWLAPTRASTDVTLEDLVERRYPPHQVLVAFLLYLGRRELQLKDGPGYYHTIRAYDERIVRYHATQDLPLRIFGARPGGDVLHAVEEERAAARKHNLQMRKRRKAAKGLDTYSAAAQATHFAPSSRLTVSSLLPPPVTTETEEEEEEEEGVEEKRPAPNPFHCTLNQVHRMRDRLLKMIGVGDGGGREFTATFFVQWFSDPALECWRGPPPPLPDEKPHFIRDHHEVGET